jgi:hypothetical protein
MPARPIGDCSRSLVWPGRSSSPATASTTRREWAVGSNTHENPLRSRAAKSRSVPFARRPSRSIRNPAASTARSVSRFGWHPPATQVQIGWMKSCKRARHETRERTCSSMRSAPSGRRTRLTSSRPRRGSPTLQKTRPLSTVSNVAARNGSASAEPTTNETAGARRRARLNASSERSRATAVVCCGSRGRFRPVPEPRSRTVPRAPATSERRHSPMPTHSYSEQMMS